MDCTLPSFQLKVSLDPAKDAISWVAAHGHGGICINCPVARAIGRAVKPRFRRWKNVQTSVGMHTIQVEALVNGRHVRYDARLPTELYKQRSNYDAYGRYNVDAVVDVVNFQRKN